MATKMWEVDPETRSKLLEISKTNDNNKCVDCGAPSPQWASPKLGIFFCLACSGIHRSLGVHISFVRSVTMDAFKTGEVKRMALGGNAPFVAFFNAHASNVGRDFEGCTIAERYDSEAGEEWKERLTAQVEGVEYVPSAAKPKPKPQSAVPTPPSTSGRNTPLRSQPAPQRQASPSQKSRNEAYFATLGNANAHRPDDLHPSQGGKFAGFGSSPAPTNKPSSSTIPSTSEFQTDPLAALTKGFGWLSSTVSKQAATVHETYVKPGIQSIADGEFAAQARATAGKVGSSVQQGTREIGETFSKFVDPDAGHPGSASSGAGQTRRAAEPEKKDFWDSFGESAGPTGEKRDFWDGFGDSGKGKATSIGTSAMKTKKEENTTWGDW